ncbi:MAG: phosphoribosylglycinamide formyltransferase [Planctomycetes bacterium]|nr:phosphoribosylglycinamide formyltransferase [Planctomycetota bacterium]
MNIGILASHSGTTLQAVIDAWRFGELQITPRLVISNNSGSGAAVRAQAHGIPFRHVSSKTHPDAEEEDQAIRDALVSYEVELVLLAGYMKKLAPETLRRFRGRVINTHPSLLPRFGGVGMYGGRVHEAVIKAGDTKSGVTIHAVDAEYDRGPIVAQCEVDVAPDDTSESLAKRVQLREKQLLIETLRGFAEGRIELPVGNFEG